MRRIHLDSELFFMPAWPYVASWTTLVALLALGAGIDVGAVE
jgi:hypothetical protein